jgi:hypothetical protein
MLWLNACKLQERVIYIDFEDSGRGILSRLRALGVKDEQLVRFHAMPIPMRISNLNNASDASASARRAEA